MRDKVIHGYSTVELAIVWKTVEEEIPRLKRLMESIQSDPESDR